MQYPRNTKLIYHGKFNWPRKFGSGVYEYELMIQRVDALVDHRNFLESIWNMQVSDK